MIVATALPGVLVGAWLSHALPYAVLMLTVGRLEDLPPLFRGLAS